MRIVPEIANGRLQVHYNRRIAGTSELQYVVQSSSDLKTWTTLSGAEISNLPSGALPGFDEIIFRATAAVSSQTPMFVRVAVQTP